MHDYNSVNCFRSLICTCNDYEFADTLYNNLWPISQENQDKLAQVIIEKIAKKRNREDIETWFLQHFEAFFKG
jgi:hypothetical protein